jgi:hypothetical protein
MKKTQRTMGRKLLEMSSEPATAREPVDLAAIRRKIGEVVGAGAVEMVRRVISEVDIEHYTAMKYLFEVAGLYPAVEQEHTAEDDSLANTLLCRLGLADGPPKETEASKDQGVEAMAAVADAVE